MNKSLEQIIDEIYADSTVSPLEYIELKKYADRAMVELLVVEGDEGTTNALCKSFEVTNQLLQLTLLKMKREKENTVFKEALIKLIDSQIVLLEMNTTLFQK